MIRKGGITIYAALIMGVMLTLIITCMTSARMAAARAQIASSAEVSLFSLFGSFDRQLLQEYEIFGLNTGGSPSAADLASLCHKAEKYMNKVLSQNSQHLEIQKLGLSGYRLLTDEGGEPFYRQAVRYEKENPGNAELLNRQRELMDFSDMCGRYMEEAREEEAQDWFSQYDAAMEEAYRLSREAEEEEYEDLLTSGEDEYLSSGAGDPSEFSTVDDPVPVMHSIYDSGLRLILTDDLQSYPGGGFTADSLLSHRTPLSGVDFQDGFQAEDSRDAELLFQCYINEKTGSFLHPSAGFPAFQMEYILEGGSSDRENLEQAVEKILLLRLGINLETIRGSEEYLSQTGELAGRICSVFRVPPDEEVIQNTLIFCWAYGESLCETNLLLSGGTVPLSGDNGISVPLSGLYVLPEYLYNNSDGNADQNGSYVDYLCLFMLRLSKAQKLLRTMDSVESVIRASGRSGFYLDHCLADAEISALVRANGRKTFTVTKSYGYD